MGALSHSGLDPSANPGNAARFLPAILAPIPCYIVVSRETIAATITSENAGAATRGGIGMDLEEIFLNECPGNAGRQALS